MASGSYNRGRTFLTKLFPEKTTLLSEGHVPEFQNAYSSIPRPRVSSGYVVNGQTTKEKNEYARLPLLHPQGALTPLPRPPYGGMPKNTNIHLAGLQGLFHNRPLPPPPPSSSSSTSYWSLTLAPASLMETCLNTFNQTELHHDVSTRMLSRLSHLRPPTSYGHA